MTHRRCEGMLHRSRQGTRTHTHTHRYIINYMYIYTLRPPGSLALLSTMLRWVWGGGVGVGGLGLGGGVLAGSGGAIALLWWAGYRLVLWLLRFHGGVATLLDRCGCYIDVALLLDFHGGVVNLYSRSLLRFPGGAAILMLDRCYIFRAVLLRWCWIAATFSGWGCYVDARWLLRCQGGFATLMLRRCYVFTNNQDCKQSSQHCRCTENHVPKELCEQSKEAGLNWW